MEYHVSAGSFDDSAAHLPFCFHELTPWRRTSIAAVRPGGGLQLSPTQNADFARASERDEELSRSINEPAIELASALSKLPKHRGIVYRGIAVKRAEVAAWVKSHAVGLMLCDPTFVSASLNMNVALKYGSTMLIRMRSCSSVAIWPISQSPLDREVVFAPGEQFIIVRKGLHRLGKSRRTIWVLDVEETSWPSAEIPKWEDYALLGEVLEEVYVPGAKRPDPHAV
jgi:predicted DNA-binding transcriptional regulator AlpA